MGALLVGLVAAPFAALGCVGDCKGDGSVDILDLVTGVDIALGLKPVTDCLAFENDEGRVDVAQLLQGVSNALNGCATFSLVGSCTAPGAGNRGLAPCAPGTKVTIFRCDNRKGCLHQQGLQQLATTVVMSDGEWSAEIPAADAGAVLVLQAGVSQSTVYRALSFGTVGGALRWAEAHDARDAPAEISPVSEAAVEILDGNGLEHYSDDGAQAVTQAVAQAAAELTFTDLSPEMAAALALQTASTDPTVITVLQTNRMPDLRFTDSGDGTIVDQQSGLIWEKKIELGGGDPSNLHAADTVYTWAGQCSLASGVLCQPNPAAAAACAGDSAGDHSACALCPSGQGPCDVDSNFVGALTTVWDWLAQLNAANFAGHSDWRLPSASDLESILDYTAFDPTVSAAFSGPSCGSDCTDLSRAACSCTQADDTWSSSVDAGTPGNVWSIKFFDGRVDSFDPTEHGYARAVRGGGAAPTPRFVDHGDGTVTDQQTGLQWERKVGLGGGVDATNLHAADNSYTWAGQCSLAAAVSCQPTTAAAAACLQSASGDRTGCASCGAGEGACDADPDDTGGLTTIWNWVVQLNAANFAGHADWRVPTAEELESLVDYTASNPAVDPLFNAATCAASCTDVTRAACGCTQAFFYWSATTSASEPSAAWDVYFADGYVSANVKPSAFFARAVRGGS